ncbi:hypothetical protein DFH07DRAFT_728103, partial [Mycena maculata]
DGDDVPLDAVLKMDLNGKRKKDFLKEAIEYQTRAKDLQGLIFPVFYGCFQARIGLTTITCLVVEYCGEPMEQFLDEIDNPFLGELLLAVAWMHEHGLRHGDLCERNILVHNRHPRIIGLESAESHDCGLLVKAAHGAIIPISQEFGCDEIHDLVRRMGFWRPGNLYFARASSKL